MKKLIFCLLILASFSCEKKPLDFTWIQKIESYQGIWMLDYDDSKLYLEVDNQGNWIQVFEGVSFTEFNASDDSLLGTLRYEGGYLYLTGLTDTELEFQFRQKNTATYFMNLRLAGTQQYLTKIL